MDDFRVGSRGPRRRAGRHRARDARDLADLAAGHARPQRPGPLDRPARAAAANVRGTGSTGWRCCSGSASATAASPTPTATCTARPGGPPRRPGAFAYAEVGTVPTRSVVERVRRFGRPPVTGTNAVVNVLRLGGRHVAVTETPDAIPYDPLTLETLDPIGYADDLPGDWCCAHPHHEPGSPAGPGIHRCSPASPSSTAGAAPTTSTSSPTTAWSVGWWPACRRRAGRRTCTRSP